MRRVWRFYPHFRKADLRTDNKLSKGFDPVTEADRAAETAMRDILALRRPQDAILGEEFGTKAGESGLTWVLDPIDGTRGFMSGTPTWGGFDRLIRRKWPYFWYY